MVLNRSIVFVGMMGVGKTTLGRMLAQSFSCPFIDIDELIVEELGRTIPDIFAKEGESFFRDVEAETIARVLSGPYCVVSTGGGAPMTSRTQDLILNKALSVWLNCDVDVILKRIGRDHNRPLLQSGDPLAVLKGLAEKRIPIYKMFDIEIKSGIEPLEDTLKKIQKAVEAHG